MSILSLMMITAVTVVAIMGIVWAIITARKNGQAQVPWEKIRPILTEVFTQVLVIERADKTGYQSLEDYAVNYVISKIMTATFLSPEEKALFSPELVRGLIAPRLHEIYTKTTTPTPDTQTK